MIFSTMLLFGTMYAQRLEVGIKVTGSAANGDTKLPAVNSGGYSVPAFTAKFDKLAPQLMGGVYGRWTLNRNWFLQTEILYTHFTLKQQTGDVRTTFSNVPVDANGTTIAGNINYTNTKPVSSVWGIDVPLFVGKRFGNFRVYGGPSFLFVTKSEQKTTYENGSYQINTISNPAFAAPPPFGFGSSTVPYSTFKANQPDEAQQIDAGVAAQVKKQQTEDLSHDTEPPLPNRRIKKLIIPFEVGVGYKIADTGFAIDVRYSVPVFTGVYANKDIKGFLGVTTLSLSYRLIGE